MAIAWESPYASRARSSGSASAASSGELLRRWAQAVQSPERSLVVADAAWGAKPSFKSENEAFKWKEHAPPWSASARVSPRLGSGANAAGCRRKMPVAAEDVRWMSDESTPWMLAEKKRLDELKEQHPDFAATLDGKTDLQLYFENLCTQGGLHRALDSRSQSGQESVAGPPSRAIGAEAGNNAAVEIQRLPSTPGPRSPGPTLRRRQIAPSKFAAWRTYRYKQHGDRRTSWSDEEDRSESTDQRRRVDVSAALAEDLDPPTGAVSYDAKSTTMRNRKSIRRADSRNWMTDLEEAERRRRNAVLCANLARQYKCNADDVQDALLMFTRYDVHGTCISYDEFLDLLRRRAHLADTDKLPRHLLGPMMLPIASQEQNFQVGFEEFLEWWSLTSWLRDFQHQNRKQSELQKVARQKSLSIDEVERIQKIFEEFTTDGLEGIVEQQFKHLLYKLWEVNDVSLVPVSWFREGWRELDAEGAGCVEFMDFLSWYQGQHVVLHPGPSRHSHWSTECTHEPRTHPASHTQHPRRHRESASFSSRASHSARASYSARPSHAVGAGRFR
mmetsp:Transcript_14018/g.29319  ORF Transcript_14018/g.29319 Transcript_14018/m.29319 type:complete len:559 (-) Transcript_14018:72-1748(-)